MATRNFARSLLAAKQSLTFLSSHSYATASAIPNSSSFLFRLRPLVTALSASQFPRLVPEISNRAFATTQTNSSLNDPNPNWSNRPPKETILLDGCDFEHWLMVMDPPEGDVTRDEIIDSYIKTLAQIVGSEEEARMKIYSVSTRHYFAFGALVSEEMSYKIKELPKVRWVLPDSYLDVKNKDYGGEPFINGQAVPYDPKYHEEWVRNNARAQDRNRRNDRPRNNDRSRNFAPRRDVQGQNFGPNGGAPGGNYGGQPNMPLPPGPNAGPRQPNYAAGPPQNNPGNYPANNMRGPGPNSGGVPYQPGPGPNNGVPYQTGPGPNQGGFPSGPGQNQNYPGRGFPSPPNQRYGGGQTTVNFDPSAGYGNQNYAPPNMGPGQGQYGNAYAPQQNHNVPGRDYPPSSNY